MAQALDLGFEHRNGSRLMAETCRILEGAKAHGVRFFTVDAEALAGTGAPPIPGGGEGAFTLCRCKGRWGDGGSPPLERDEMRVKVNPTGGNYSPTGDGFPYNRLVHVLWHELHHCTTTQHHKKMDAPYWRPGDPEPPDPWVGAMTEIARAFPRTACDPETGREVILFAPDQWTRRDAATG